jgi:hypothetical protein
LNMIDYLAEEHMEQPAQQTESVWNKQSEKSCWWLSAVLAPCGTNTNNTHKDLSASLFNSKKSRDGLDALKA